MILPTIITLPEGYATTTLGYVGEVFSDLSGLILIIVGVLIGAVVIEIVVGAIRHQK